MIFWLLSIAMLISGCAKTVTETKIQYVSPEIPKSLLEPCDQIQQDSIKTNGDLLMSYISLQTSYAICSAKVNSISSILDSYNALYNLDINLNDNAE
jgi:hypothetical protein